MRDHLHLLQTKRFYPLFITQFLGAFNDNAFKNAFLIWFTYDVASYRGLDAPMMVTLAAGLFILPFFLFSALAGQVADAYEKSWLTQKIKLVEVILMLGCAVCFFLKSIEGLLVLLCMMGVQSTFFGPIKYSLLPEHLEEEELIAGNGFIEGGTFLAILLGTLFGGLIITAAQGVELLSLCVVLFSVIGYLASRLIPAAPIGDTQLTIGWNIAKETWYIVGHARKEPTVWLAIIGISWFWLIGATFLTQFPTYTKQVIGGNEHIVTLFLTLFSIGIGVGSMWCNRLLKGEINGRLVPYGALGMSIAIFCFTLASYGYMAEREAYMAASMAEVGFTQFFHIGISSSIIIVSLLGLSVCAGLYIVPLYAIMQHRSEGQFLARIIAANNVMNALFMVCASIAMLLLFAVGFTVTEILLTVGIVNIPVFFLVRRVVIRRLGDA